MRRAHARSIATLVPATLALSLGLGVGLLAAGGPGCNVQSIFTCTDDTNCQTHGEGGVCEANSFCTFPDAECPSGKRWHDRAGDLAGDCFDDGAGTGGGSGGSGDSGSSDEAPADTGDSGSDTLPVTTADSSSGEPPDPSTGPEPADSSSGGSGSTGAPGMCDAQYGAAADYMLCTETVDACTFSTTTGMVMTCNDVCTGGGGTCITAHTNDVELCTMVAETTCDDATSNDLICVCSNGA